MAEAFIIGETCIDGSNVCLILGDNIFWGQGFTPILSSVVQRKNGATIFGYKVKDTGRFGVVEFDDNNQVTSIEEKPKYPKSNFAVTGLYFYDESVVDIAKDVVPSDRGELEITSINKVYLDKNQLNVELLGRGFAWLDTGTHESLLDASCFVENIEARQGFKIACLEEIGFNQGWIDTEQIQKSISRLGNNSYKKYLMEMID